MVTWFLLLGCLSVGGSGCGPPALAAAWGAAPFVPFGQARARGDSLQALAAELESQRPDQRKRAVRQLVALGSPEAWRLLFRALADEEAEVGDQVQLSLSQLPDALLARELAGRAGLGHRDPRVRLRAAEGLGRVAYDLDVALLLAAIDDREAEVAHLALWSLERLANQDRLSGDLERGGGLLERTSRTHRDGWVRASAVCARAALFSAARRAQNRQPTAAGFDEQRQAEVAARRLDDFERWLERATEDRDARVRCAVAMALRHLPASQALRVGRALSGDPQHAVRTAQIEAWEALACTASVQALIARLEHESVARVRTQIALALQRLSGFKHRDDPRPWRDWANGLAADWKPTLMPASASTPASANAGGGVGGEARSSARASFAGLSLLSSRICFAIDFSGSMWTPMPDGRLPKELVDARLRATLESLPASTHFNIVVFTNEVIPWRPKLVPAQPFQVRSAIADFERCQERGRGNFFDAAVFALDDPEVDTLLTLSDGVPTGGFHSHLDLVIPLLLERNRFRRVAFDTVLVDAPSAAERRWRVLSEYSGGRLVSTGKAD